MAEKLYYSIGEVSEMFDVNPSLLRYWEREFSILKPHRNEKSKRRLFTATDIENLKLIYHLVKERGMTLEGAKKAMRARRGSKNLRGSVEREAELMERLQQIRALLVEVREELKEPGEALMVDNGEPAEVNEIVEATPAPKATKRAPKPAEAAPAEKTETVVEAAVEATAPVAEEPATEQTETATEQPATTPERPAPEAATEQQEVDAAEVEQTVTPERKRPGRPRRRKRDEGENKELFAFYEQSLF